MRISSLQVFASGLRGITDAQSSVARTQAEISAGRRVLTPADDPAAASLALRIEQEKALDAQYQRNGEVAERDLRLEESQLQSVEEILFRLRELVIQAGDGALSVTEREAIISEANARREELVGLFNTRAANGEYLFAGFQGNTQPFVTRGAGAVDYAGDEGRRFLQLAPGVEVEVRDNGRELFVDVPSANNTFRTLIGTANAGTGDITTGRIVDQAAFDAVYPDDLVLTFGNPPNTFTVASRDHATGALVPLLGAQPWVPGQVITVAGAEFTIAGAPAAGDSFVIEASRTQSILDTVQRFVDGLRAGPDTPAGATERARVIAETLDNLDRAEQHVIGARSALGSRLNVVESTREEQSAVELINEKALSDLVNVDYEEAISRLSFQSFVLEAAQKSFARVAGLSLFNLLR
jgi:flagellar hook-associated protein 3 FlgL